MSEQVHEITDLDEAPTTLSKVKKYAVIGLAAAAATLFVYNKVQKARQSDETPETPEA